MKHIFALIFSLCAVVSLSAQGVVRTGLYNEGGVVKYSDPQSSVTVSVVVKTDHFTPGEYARYAQKMLGVRASLAARVQTQILSATITDKTPTTAPLKQVTEPVEPQELPVYKSDNRAQSVEQQAAAAADIIFAMRRHRKELITGDAGENVFGAGLASALAQIDAMEQQCLALFYGTTKSIVEEYRYTVTPTAEEQNYILARYRNGVGMVSVGDLSGEPIALCFVAQDVDTSALPLATEKDKNKAQFAVPAQCKAELMVGTESLATAQMAVYQYGKHVTLALPSSK